MLWHFLTFPKMTLHVIYDVRCGQIHQYYTKGEVVGEACSIVVLELHIYLHGH